MKKFAPVLLALCFAQAASAYTYIYGTASQQPIKWDLTSVVMHVNMGTNPTTADTNRNQAVVAAMNIWNSNLSTVQFVPIVDMTTHMDTDNGDHVNQIAFDTMVYGTSFGGATLAVTTNWSFQNNQRSEADIIFNLNGSITISGNPYTLTWDSYRGPQQGSGNPANRYIIVDLRRVALHELGHVLGLNHPDQETDGSDPNVSAIMHSSTSDIDNLTSDDLGGAQHLYGTPGGAAPANNNFANATLINEGDGRPYAGSNIYPNVANREGGEPLIVTNQGGHSVWWKWVAPSAGSVSVDTRGSFIDTTMGVYTGASVNALTLVGQNDDEGTSVPGHTSLVSFSAVSGTTYYIAVDGFYYNDGTGAPYNILGDTGNITVHLNFANAGTAPTVSTPGSTTVATGAAASFSVTATGTPTPTLQWQWLQIGTGTWITLSNSGAYSGVTTGTLTVNPTTNVMNGDQFRCVASNSNGTVTSGAASLTVLFAPMITAHPQPRSVAAGAITTFTGTAAGSPTPTFQWQIQPFGSGSFSNLSNNANYSGVTTGTLSVTTTGPMNGDQFRLIFTNSQGSVSSNAATLSITGIAPTVSTPSNTTVAAGSSAPFTVTATGTPAPTLQWQWLQIGTGTWIPLANAGAYSGVTTTILTVSPTTNVMNGDQFRCVATNSVSATTGGAAMLTVNYAPIITMHPQPQSVISGSSATIVATAAGNPTPSVQWQIQPFGSGSFSNLTNNATYSGVTSTTLTITNTTLGMNGDQFRLVATNSQGSVNSNSGTLTVTTPTIGVLGDLNGDAKSDILLINTSTGERAVWLMNGATISSGASLGVLASNWVFSGMGDFNGDGKADILLTNTSTGERAIWFMNGATVTSGVSLGVLATNWAFAGTGDFNGDGKSDILLSNTSTGERVIWLMNGATITTGASLGVLPVQWTLSRTGDFNGDGKYDIALTNTSTGERAIWIMNGTVITSAASLGVLPVTWDLSGTGDFNGDGKSDLVLTNQTSGERVIWLMNGASIASGATLGVLPPVWALNRVGDFDGDGKADIFLTNQTTGERVIWLMNGATITAGASFGILSTDWTIGP